MSHVNTVILGAGPSGLSLANRLLQFGDDSFVVFEKESEAGGLCRSKRVDGAPLDIGGGHFLDTRRPEANNFLFGFLPESEWDSYVRRSTIRVRGHEIDYPFEANLWQFPTELQLDYLESIARAGCITGTPRPESFREWVAWKLGDLIARDYMIPYNEKIWCLDSLDELGTYWLYKLPDVSFRDTLRSCLEKRRAGKVPAHGTFYYPKSGGYGHVWEIMARELGDKLLLERAPTAIATEKLAVDEFTCDRIVTTIPWPELARVTPMPSDVSEAVTALKNAPIEIAYYPQNLQSTAHWTYVPSPDIKHHRLLLRHNFCPGARGHWTETNAGRAAAWPHQGEQQAPEPGWSRVNNYAYPLNTVDKPAALKTIREWGEAKAIIGLGRWGQWEHMNSDVAVQSGMTLAEDLVDNIA